MNKYFKRASYFKLLPVFLLPSFAHWKVTNDLFVNYECPFCEYTVGTNKNFIKHEQEDYLHLQTREKNERKQNQNVFSLLLTFFSFSLFQIVIPCMGKHKEWRIYPEMEDIRILQQ